MSYGVELATPRVWSKIVP